MTARKKKPAKDPMAKFKPIMFFIPWHPTLGLLWLYKSEKRKHCISFVEAAMRGPWAKQKKQGWRILKMKMGEMK